MKRLMLLVVLAAACFVSTGCTLTETPSQRNRRLSQITDLQLRMAVEDWDYIWLYEHSAETSMWHPWVGI